MNNRKKVEDILDAIKDRRMLNEDIEQEFLDELREEIFQIIITQ